MPLVVFRPVFILRLSRRGCAGRSLTYVSSRLPQREILWIKPVFPGAPSLVESGGIFMGIAGGRAIYFYRLIPCLPDGADAYPAYKITTDLFVTFSSPDAASPVYGPAARGLIPVHYRRHRASRWCLRQWWRPSLRLPAPPAGCRTRQTRRRQSGF